MLSAIPLIVDADVRLLQNQSFPIGFISILALTGVLSATPLIVVADVRLLQNQCSHWFYNHFGSHWGGAVCDPARRGC